MTAKKPRKQKANETTRFFQKARPEPELTKSEMQEMLRKAVENTK